MAKPALGRGLGALLGGNTPPGKAASAPAVAAVQPEATAPASEPGERVLRVGISRVHPCPFQPRKDFSEESLQELADSIREQGILQPLLVRSSNGNFELIAGERRWRAAQLAGLAEIPVVVREADDRKVLELALIENLQRENLNPIEEALGYSELMNKFQLTQEEAALRVGKSRSVVANALRLLRLADSVREQLRSGRLSVGHGKVLAGLESPQEQIRWGERSAEAGWSVRQLEDSIASSRNGSAGKPKSANASPVRDFHVTDLENRIRERVGTKVALRYRQGKGSLELKFFTDDELERLLQMLGIDRS